MPINYDALMSTSVLDEPYEYTEKDTMLYAIGVGFGSDPVDQHELHYVSELRALRTVPSICTVSSVSSCTDLCRRRQAC
jgi:hypothetical protein